MKTLKTTFLAVVFLLIGTTTFSQARVQVIHNSADAAAAVVDVWLNDALLLDNFAFRTASPFIDAPAGVEFTVAIQGSDSQSAENPIWSQNYTLADGETYILVANGIVSASGYDPAPAFDIYAYAGAREMASSESNVDVLVFHGSTDAPTVDIVEVEVGAGTIVDNLSYGEYAGYLELPEADYVLEIRDETGTTTVATYQAPLGSLNLGGMSVSVLASGFLAPQNNSDGPSFDLLAVLADGTALLLTPAGINESPVDLETFKVYPNPATESLNVSFELKESNNVVVEFIDITGRTLKTKNLGSRTANVYNEKIDVAQLPMGLYMLNVRTDNSVVSKKVFVQ